MLLTSFGDAADEFRRCCWRVLPYFGYDDNNQMHYFSEFSALLGKL